MTRVLMVFMVTCGLLAGSTVVHARKTPKRSVGSPLYYYARAVKKDWDWKALKKASKKLYYLARELKNGWDWKELYKVKGSFP